MRPIGIVLAAGLLSSACAAPPAREADAPVSTAAPAPAPAPALAAPPPAAPAPSAAEVRAVAPELTERAAAEVVARSARPGQVPEAVAESALAIASRGIPALSPAEQGELGQLLDGAYAALAPSERERLGTYLDRARAGQASPAETVAGRRLFNEALRGLPQPRLARLAELFEQAIAAGIRTDAEAADRTRQAQTIQEPLMAGVAPNPPSTSVVPGPIRGTLTGALPGQAPSRHGAPAGRGEAYWRAEAQRRRDRVANAERELAAAESVGLNVHGPSNILERSELLAKKAQLDARIERARRELAAARQRLSDLDDEARRDYAMPGWLR
jgi:hypothetical protein